MLSSSLTRDAGKMVKWRQEICDDNDDHKQDNHHIDDGDGGDDDDDDGDDDPPSFAPSINYPLVN